MESNTGVMESSAPAAISSADAPLLQCMNVEYESSKIGPLNCQVCGKIYASKHSLRRHMTVHQEKIHRCPSCEKEFPTRFLLTTHLRSHTGEKEKPFECEQCGKAYAILASLKRHQSQLSHKSNGMTQVTGQVNDSSSDGSSLLEGYAKTAELSQGNNNGIDEIGLVPVRFENFYEQVGMSSGYSGSISCSPLVLDVGGNLKGDDGNPETEPSVWDSGGADLNETALGSMEESDSSRKYFEYSGIHQEAVKSMRMFDRHQQFFSSQEPGESDASSQTLQIYPEVESVISQTNPMTHVAPNAAQPLPSIRSGELSDWPIPQNQDSMFASASSEGHVTIDPGGLPATSHAGNWNSFPSSSVAADLNGSSRIFYPYNVAGTYSTSVEEKFFPASSVLPSNIPLYQSDAQNMMSSYIPGPYALQPYAPSGQGSPCFPENSGHSYESGHCGPHSHAPTSLNSNQSSVGFYVPSEQSTQFYHQNERNSVSSCQSGLSETTFSQYGHKQSSYEPHESSEPFSFVEPVVGRSHFPQCETDFIRQNMDVYLRPDFISTCASPTSFNSSVDEDVVHITHPQTTRIDSLMGASLWSSDAKSEHPLPHPDAVVVSTPLMNTSSPATCGECGQTFLAESMLRQHEKSHFPLRCFLCDVCGEAFPSLAILESHMNVHSGPYTCDVCDVAFSTGFLLQDHLRTHTGELAYTC